MWLVVTKVQSWLQSAITTTHVLSIHPTPMLHQLYFSSLSVVSRAFSAQGSGIILIPYITFVPNFVSFEACITELAQGEKLHTQSINWSPSSFDAPRTEQLTLKNSKWNTQLVVICASNKIQQKHVYETVNTSRKQETKQHKIAKSSDRNATSQLQTSTDIQGHT